MSDDFIDYKESTKTTQLHTNTIVVNISPLCKHWRIIGFLTNISLLTCYSTMASTPRFFSTPFKYLHWASIEKPAIFFSIVVGSLGPVMALTVPPIRRRLGDSQRPEIPLTYPSMHDLSLFDSNSYAKTILGIEKRVDADLYYQIVPSGPRKQISGYDD